MSAWMTYRFDVFVFGFPLIVISSFDTLWDHFVFSFAGTHENFLVLYEHIAFPLHIFVV